MKQFLLLCLACMFYSSAHAQNIQQRVDSIVDFYHRTLDFNGSILVADKGKVLLNKGYGYQDKAKNIKNSSNSIYMIGSVTKQFTAEIVLMLAKEGKLSLNDKLSEYYPEFPFADSVTLHQMLTHTSGIFDYTRDSTWVAHLEEVMTDEQIFAYIRNKPLNFAPGSKYSYSNSNYKLLGNIIAMVTGKSYYSNVRERIFEPLGMNQSGFDYRHLNSKYKTVGYYGVEKDSFMVSIVADSTQTNAAGSIYSTTNDLLKWHYALQHYTLLPKEWQDKAYVPEKRNYSYGWETDSIAGRYVLSHSGYIHGYNANFYHLPNEDACVVILTNLMRTGADPIVFAAHIVQAMYDSSYEIPAVRQEISLAENIKNRYTGVYTFVEDSSLQFTFRVHDQQLHLQVTGQREIPLLPQSEFMFFTKEVDAQIEFRENEKGVFDMILYQNGNELLAKKEEKQ